MTEANAKQTQAIACMELLVAAVEKAKADGRQYLDCGDFHDMEQFPGCCDSCHEDFEKYGYDPCSVKINGMYVECCCKVCAWISETKKAIRTKSLPVSNWTATPV